MNIEKYYTQHCQTLAAGYAVQFPDLENHMVYNIKPENQILRLKEQDFGFDGYDILLYPHVNQLKIDLHAHEFFEFIYIYKGNCETVIDGKRFLLKKGDLFLMNPNALHAIASLHPKEDIIFNILVKNSMIDTIIFKLISHDQFISDFFIYSMQNQRKQDNYMLFSADSSSSGYEVFIHQIIHEYYEGDLYKEQMYELLFTSLMIELTRCYREQISQNSCQSPEKNDISKIIQYATVHYTSITLSSLARHFHYTPNHVSMLIKKYSGNSFSDMIHAIRIKKAAQLILESSLPIYDVMMTVGYSNRTWFSKKFKETYGMTPAEYRKYGSPGK